MKDFHLQPLMKEIEIIYSGEKIQLSSIRKNEIENFWTEINKTHTFFRGEVFTVESILELEKTYRIVVNRTDYAHYLHTVKNNLVDEEACKVIFGAGLVETIDSFFILGEMACHTAYPGRVQFVGGGLGWEDLKEDRFDIKASVLRELHEELGVTSKYVSNCKPVHVKIGGTYNSIVILFHITIDLSKKEFLHHYSLFINKLCNKGEKPEFK